jgi:hypothetical protein
MKKGMVLLGATGILVVLLGGCFEPPVESNSLYVYPQKIYKDSDTEFQISIKSDLIQNIYGFETEIKYDGSIITIIDYQWGDFFPQNSFFSNPKIDNENGKITEVYALIIGSSGVKSSKDIITFKCIGREGNCTIELINSALVNNTEQIIFEVINGEVVIVDTYDHY